MKCYVTDEFQQMKELQISLEKKDGGEMNHGGKLKEEYYDMRISIWDHNKEKLLDRAEESFRVNGADKAIDGIAFHWYLILDEKGGPNHVGNFCDAPVMCNTKEDTIDVKLSYYYIGHFSKFIQPGAKRILASGFSKNLEVVAFMNPGGEKILIILNESDKEIPFTVTDNVLSGEIIIKEHSIMTLCW